MLLVDNDQCEARHGSQNRQARSEHEIRFAGGDGVPVRATLAIGQSAAGGEVSLAVLLVIGFALHNATEGFGIVGPLAAEGIRPSWGWLGLAGLVGGGPTFLGTVVGSWFSSEVLFVAFLATLR